MTAARTVDLLPALSLTVVTAVPTTLIPGPPPHRLPRPGGAGGADALAAAPAGPAPGGGA